MTTNKVLLRQWQLSDVPSLVKYANNPNIAKNLRDAFPNPYTLENAINFINMANSKEPSAIFAIDMSGEAIGGIGLHPQNDIQRMNAELGYWLAEPFWGQGIISQAIVDIVAFGFRELEINRIFAIPFGSNIASQRALEKAGFTLEARFEKTLYKNGEFEDELVYAIRKNYHEALLSSSSAGKDH
ncbi:MAG: GNAT family N-acetyltransferase [Saprospiraceae bacterium]|nr:GNAT family N-acetyltransferase [Saprospiraceae bacterium]